ncbi:hypothetical protein V8C35DRAFT_279093 [Trichoderma chlorosporum]
MSLRQTCISFLGLVAMGTFATALQINIYSDHNCQEFIGSFFPGDCDQLPTPNGGIGSWLIVCQNNFSDNCESITFFNSNGGNCAGEHAVDALSYSCNAEPSNDDDRICQSTVGAGAHFWGLRDVESPITLQPLSTYQWAAGMI